MNHTPNYQLNQWEADDRVQRVDFNADNAKIDAALAGLPVELRRVKLTGAAKKITFDLTDVDLEQYPRLRVVCPQLNATAGQMGIQVNGTTSGYVRQSATSTGGSSPSKYATIGGYGTVSTSSTEIFSLAGGTAFHSDSMTVTTPGIVAIWNWCFLHSQAYRDLKNLDVMCEKEEAYYTAGSEVLLYGLRA